MSALSIWNKPKWKNCQFWVFKKNQYRRIVGFEYLKIWNQRTIGSCYLKNLKEPLGFMKELAKNLRSFEQLFDFFTINYLRIGDMLPMYSGVWKKNLLLSLTFSQFWLNPFVNDYQSTCITKLKKKKKPLGYQP